MNSPTGAMCSSVWRHTMASAARWAVGLGVEVRDPGQPVGHRRVDALGVDAGIDADAGAGAGLDHPGQELALAAADLQHRAARQVVLVDPAAGQALRPLDEQRREALRLLVAGRVLGLLEHHVGDEPAGRAEAQPEVAGREAGRLLQRVEQQAGVRGDARLLEEDVQPALPAGRTGGDVSAQRVRRS